MALTIGVVGKPNAGKSTFFSALTMAEAKIAAFPFTTLEPNIGVGYVRKKCPHPEIGKECKPKDSFCRKGTRFVPVRLLDVAGLVPDAHKGRGLGFRFLDDLASADALIHVIDASGKTDLEGRASESHDPALEISFLRKELLHWVNGIIAKNWKKVRTRDISALSGVLTGMKIPPHESEEAARRLSLDTKRINWSEEERLAFAGEILKCKPVLVAANKCDQGCDISRLSESFPEAKIVPCSALYELTLKKADASGAISYVPGDSSFQTKSASPKQKAALEAISAYLDSHGGTGVQFALEELVYGMMRNIVAFPVEDDSRWSDAKGNVLPNSFLLEEGSTPLDLAAKVHTDLAKNFVCAIDARRHVKLSKEYQLKDCDIIKIVSR
jgi:ribosome-binding ATPase YchF (GTP1/OBG family)